MHARPRPAIGALAALALVLTGGVATAGAAHAAPATTAPLVINEVYGGGGNSGATYDRDFVELYNPTAEPVDTAGWSVQYASAAGAVYQVTPLTGVVPAGGQLLVAQAAGSGGTVTVEGDVVGTIPMSSTSGKVALVAATGALTCAGTCSAAPEVVDLVGYGAANDYAGTGPAPGLTNATSASRDAAHTHTADNAADFTAGTPTPQGLGGGSAPDDGTYTVAEIQGTGTASPLVGATVTTSGVVTAAYPTGGFQGYVIQTPGTGGALDPARNASDAVFVYSSATVGSVTVGDHVEVTGVVSEFNGLTEITVAAGGLRALPDAADVAPLTGSWPATAEGREAIESMLLAPEGHFTVTNTYSTNQYGEVGLAAGTTPLLQPTEVGRPGSPEAAGAVADNAARGVVLDDGATTNFLSSANQSLTPPYLSLENPVRVGAAATFTEPVVVDYRNNSWKLNPTRPYVAGGPAPVTFENDRTPTPAAVGGDVTVASFNVLNYFTTLGADTAACEAYRDRAGDPVTVSTGCAQRGAWDPDDLQRQQDKIVAAIDALDADVVGLLEIENSAVVDGVADEALGTLVDALNAAAGAGTWAFVPSSDELPDVALQDTITNALIYRTASVERTGESRALGTASASGQAFANAREPIAQAFTPVGGGEPVLVVVNHLKSKGSAGPWTGDADTGDGQGASNESRVRQATALRDWVPTVQGDVEAVALVGDFNAYTREDPLQVLYDAGYVDAVETLAPGQWSYSFSGLSGSLDHVLLNEAARARATGADVWEINAEESVALEYSRYNYHGSLFHADDPYRSSDHDPVLVGLSAGESDDGPVDLTFLNINDFHGRIDGNTVKFAGTVEEQRAAAEGPVAFLSAGDNIGASLFASSVQQDQPTIDVLDALDLAASAVGNHEFDAGYQDLVDRVIADGANARFPYLGANVYLEGTATSALDEYALLDMDGVTVGVIGAVTQETPTLVRPDGIAGLEFGDPVEAVNRVAAQLTDGDASNGEADVLVAQYHEGAGAGTPDGATLEEEVAAGGAFADIVTGTDPAVDAIFTGHTHKQYAWFGPAADDATRPVVQTGSYGELLGKVVLTYDPATDEVTAATAENVARTTTPDADLVAAYPRVAAVADVVAQALAYATEVGSQPVGSVTADVTTAFGGGSFVDGVYVGSAPGTTTGRDDRSRESTLGSLVADALLETLAAPERGGAQIGVVNPGGMRAELLYAPDGTITYAEANAVLPFVNNLWTTTLTGAQVVTMLEQQWQTNADGTIPSRPYLQLGLSDNVSYTYDATRELGDRVTSVTVDGAPIDPDAEYRIGTFSFLAQGGDNFRVLAEGARTADSGLIDRDAWVAYLQAHPGVAPDFGERAVAVPELEPVIPGGELSFEVGGLNLTSLGAPQNTEVEVRLGDDVLGTFPLTQGASGPEASGRVTVAVPDGLEAGRHLLTVVASPSGTTTTVPFTVDERTASSTTTLTASPSSQVSGTRGTRVRLTALVEAPVDATGPVQFLVAEDVLGTASLRDGRAVLTLPADTPAGTYEVVARWAGDDAVAGSQSAPVTVTVERATSSTSLTVLQSPLPRLVPSVWVATVGLDTARLPQGHVELREGDRVLARADVVLGLAAGTVPRGIGSGTHRLTAVFVPDAPQDVAGSTSSVVTVRG
ncbi:5'-Nucleotidase domain protein [Cellulomonas flavigena DSM 20109]|uniref:5'-Nucleotidase domain protein n=1 Tax=Cellulomonas flavigena (strain ATCC 482 / DSM 20109 / BCRC 11376 / JCM 18109 / NBRC 3775 / NCIMB 8073 / NRS 134) TaxID=446466 RepID=D5UDX1_CELFN|nr:ExeM/NucH family extracellular endonuclease [Cellulomonas flavigena]ADG74529.1 5'-Nucleotidase domain protein [Cellulomonas flavigena DSM 20109]